MEAEPHVLQTIAELPEAQLRPLVARMTQWLLNREGVAVLLGSFPELEARWHWPRHHSSAGRPLPPVA